MVAERVDVLRAVQQPGYAARFTNDQWQELVRDPLWADLAGEMPEVLAVLHRFNLPQEYKEYRFGGGPPFRYIFNEEVYEQGAPVVALAAESDHIADEALRQIVVEYEVLPHVLDPIEGMRPTTP